MFNAKEEGAMSFWKTVKYELAGALSWWGRSTRSVASSINRGERAGPLVLVAIAVVILWVGWAFAGLFGVALFAVVGGIIGNHVSGDQIATGSPPTSMSVVSKDAAKRQDATSGTSEPPARAEAATSTSADSYTEPFPNYRQVFAKSGISAKEADLVKDHLFSSEMGGNPRFTSDPDYAQASLQSLRADDHSIAERAAFKLVESYAYSRRGLRNLAAALDERAGVDPATDIASEYEALLDENDLDDLEQALTLLVEADERHPGIVRLITQDEDTGVTRYDVIGQPLERCRPGRVQEIAGFTKLYYIGPERMRTASNTISDITPFMMTPFTAERTVKSILTVARGTDSGREYLSCGLIDRLDEEVGRDEGYGDSLFAYLTFYDDGSVEEGMKL